MKDVRLIWPNYKLFPYEKQLAIQEASVLLHPKEIIEKKGFIIATDVEECDNASDLVYFHSYEYDGKLFLTKQGRREGEQSRQNTRYCSHGIHEYKGKFNPQIVRAIINIYGQSTASIIDPFCGSGTSVLESNLQGINAVGVDINPLAVFIARTKLAVYHEAAKVSQFKWDSFRNQYEAVLAAVNFEGGEREEYLRSWFVEPYFSQIEAIRITANRYYKGAIRDLILVCTSNLLRDYSEQEPTDLRIRRRFSPYPSIPILDGLKSQIENMVAKVTAYGEDPGNTATYQIQNTSIIEFNKTRALDNSFGLAITSPPYAMALPYIDTQRLSLIWLSLCPPSDIRKLEETLIGAREISKKSTLKEFSAILQENPEHLCAESVSICKSLHEALKETDGFRKQAVPFLLYRYFKDMRRMFSSLYSLLQEGAYYCLVVGYNRTSIGGGVLIDTPRLLSNEAKSTGFSLESIIPLETYQRYGMHVKNAITSEALIVLKK